MSVFTGGLFGVCEGQLSLTKAAALSESLLVQLIFDVTDQDLKTMTDQHVQRMYGKTHDNVLHTTAAEKTCI